MKRDKFTARRIILRGQLQRDLLLSLIPHLPLDDSKPLVVTIGEEQPVRKLDANAEYWAAPLRDIAEQAYVNRRTFPADVWHEHFKREYLFEEYDEELTKEGYRKWDYTPSGERVLVGSTTQLTVKGFAIYREQVIAFGAQCGVQFHASPNDGRRAA